MNDSKNDRSRAPMRGLASLPVFFDLAGKRVLLAGGTPQAAWKVELLQATGAKVDVFCPNPSEEMRALTAQAPQVRLVARDWDARDFSGAVLAVGDCADDAEAARFQAAARSAGVPVNVIDKPAFCDFQFGAIIDRSPLVIAISTTGAAPVLALVLRGRLEALLPPGLKQWAEVALNWRPNVKTPNRRFWELFVARALSSRAPRDGDFAELIEAAQQPAPDQARGALALIAITSDDPEHLTLKALRLLQAADVVVHDATIASVLADMARREALKIAVDTQDEAFARIVALVRTGKKIAWLRDGAFPDHIEKEIAALKAAGFEIES